MLRTLCVASLVGLLASGPALAQDRSAAAASVAKDVANGLSGAGLKSRPMMMAPLRDGAAFTTALTQALIDAGINVVDQSAVAAAIAEASLSESAGDAELKDVAGALGAKLLLSGSVDAAGGSFMVNVRVTEVTKGKVLVTTSASFASGGEVSKEAKTIEAQLRRLADKIAAGLDRVDGEARYQRFAIMPFQEVGESTRDKELGLLVSADLTTKLQRNHNLMIVERDQLEKIISEMALGQSGLTDPEQSAKVGELAGAQALVLGTVSEVGDRYLVSARVVATATGKVVVAEETHLPAADLIALSADAVVLRTRMGAVYRSILLPGWGQLYNRQPVKAGIFVAGELLAIGGAVTFHLLGDAQEKKYDQLQNGRFDRRIEEAEGHYTLRNVFIYVAIGLHALNILDAYLSGVSYDSSAPGSSASSFLSF